MSQPEVSVVVPAWGPYAGAPLAEALASIAQQDAPARLVVVDNASEAPLDVEGEVELVHCATRRTVGGARNLGLEHVTTPYVVFWDADDVMLPGTLGFLLGEIAADPNIVAVAGGVLEESGSPHRWPPGWSARLARHRTVFALAHSIWSLFPSTGGTIMRTEQVRECGGYDAGEGAVSAEDWVLGVSLAHRGRIELRTRPGRVYRRLGSSLWGEHRSRARRLQQAASVRARLRDDPGIPAWGRLSARPLVLIHPLVLLVAAPLARRMRRWLAARG